MSIDFSAINDLTVKEIVRMNRRDHITPVDYNKPIEPVLVYRLEGEQPMDTPEVDLDDIADEVVLRLQMSATPATDDNIKKAIVAVLTAYTVTEK